MLGDVCSAIKKLPTSTEPSKFTTEGKVSVRSGGSTDCRRVQVDKKTIAIKHFRIYSATLPMLEEAKNVSKRSTREARSQIMFPDHVEIGTCVEETSAQKRPTVPWCHPK